MSTLLDSRAKLAAALAPVEPNDPVVLTNLVDALEPPALMLGWGDPWLQPSTACLFEARLVVTAVAARLIPGSGVETLEQLVSYTLARIKATDWPLESVSGPRVFPIAKTNYLAARITLRSVVTEGSL